mmetsp:Transcript_3902/g.6800  ORF Transcript_3902/g.6800 Transcript_3902/m.6800 type:complete len:252 (-) Transcript_3902:680-1435(-)
MRLIALRTRRISIEGDTTWPASSSEACTLLRIGEREETRRRPSSFPGDLKLLPPGDKPELRSISPNRPSPSLLKENRSLRSKESSCKCSTPPFCRRERGASTGTILLSLSSSKGPSCELSPDPFGTSVSFSVTAKFRSRPPYAPTPLFASAASPRLCCCWVLMAVMAMLRSCCSDRVSALMFSLFSLSTIAFNLSIWAAATEASDCNLNTSLSREYLASERPSFSCISSRLAFSSSLSTAIFSMCKASYNT